METKTSVSFAEQLGLKIGSVVLFLLFDKNATVRWLKRAAIAVLLMATVFTFKVELAKALITLSVLVMLGALVVRSGIGQPSRDSGADFSPHPSIPRDGPDGFGYYDAYGNFCGSSNPFDGD
ncbi:hypothetical protein [Pseudomonas sp. RC10]|uniref:hypothetical protein n=1 Tax=Pseudomonas bambusae TaxID=3139142 RepID=UPI003139DC65